MIDLRTEEVAPSKQDVPVAALHHMVALNGEQEDSAGLAASQLRQQDTLRRCCSIGQEIAQFTVDHHPCDNQPEAQ